jgi:pilus assembly protein Flp/PilA
MVVSSLMRKEAGTMILKLEKTWTTDTNVTAVRNWVVRLIQDERGQDMIEYALMAATIAVAVAAIFPQSIAPNISTIFSKVSSSLGAANL